MSPEEVTAAAFYKNTTTEGFIEDYAGYRLETTTPSGKNNPGSKSVSAGEGEVPWILLRNQGTENNNDNNNEPAACIFLDRQTNRCGIYSVRPIQCSTYPFWSNILESEQHWNDEVRRKDNDEERHDLPAWTAEGGGCEGMKILGTVEEEKDEEAATAEAIPVATALEQLSLYKRADRRLPRSHNRIPVSND